MGLVIKTIPNSNVIKIYTIRIVEILENTTLSTNSRLKRLLDYYQIRFVKNREAEYKVDKLSLMVIN